MINYFDLFRKTPAEIYADSLRHNDNDIAELIRMRKDAEAANVPDIEPKEEKKKVKVEYVIDEKQLAKELDKALKRIFR